MYENSRVEQWPHKAEPSTAADASELRNLVIDLRDRHSRELTAILFHHLVLYSIHGLIVGLYCTIAFRAV
jgi:hypothetical protein